jgi:membrane-bound lytic murein transglycosylase D
MRRQISRSITLFSMFMFSFLLIAIFSSLVIDKNERNSSDAVLLSQRIQGVNLNRSFGFAGEALPTDNFDVLERLDRELLVNAYSHATTLLNIKHSKRYFPVFERILAAHGIPDDFKYLAVAESNFRFGTSSAGAKGLWQFMSGTAKGYGLEISDDVDERLHVEKSTEAACKLLLDYKKRFGTWMLAATAYNFGETRMAKELEAQRSNSFFDLNLNTETSRYLFRIIAIKEIMSNPETYGYAIEEEQFYQPLNDYKVVEVSTTINNLSAWAADQGVSYRMLKLYNPWLLNSKLLVKPGKTYKVKLPV